MDTTAFQELIRRVRHGDEQAAVALVLGFEPVLRRHVRLLLTDPRLREVLDSIDICQSVLGNFFVRAASGQFDLEHPAQLARLLSAMARNRILNHARSAAHRQKTNTVNAAPQQLEDLPEPGPGPARQVSGRELLRRVEEALSDAERDILGRRQAGQTWEQIAEGLGEKPDTVRRRHTRAIDRVARDLGLDDLWPGGEEP
jgi:RNA polymerase sigma factor (sigma-70 family)